MWNEFWLKNTSVMTYSQWESKIQGSGKFADEFSPTISSSTIFFFPLQISVQTICIANYFCATILLTFPFAHENCDLAFFLLTWLWNVVCGPDRVVGDSSYCKVMQCETSCFWSIMQCEQSSSCMVPQIAVMCAYNSDPTTLKIMQCELGIRKNKN